MHGHGLSARGEPTYRTRTPTRPEPAQNTTVQMLKTFSLSALFFMTVGLLLATHLSLPF
ncbi:hypothetical protein PRN20_12140 [Devosia sp. ZB163]|uniref:hypothetical protein n=1 Tax=Devosia sp. ZB163 TaxID=3025938 RepID=UPI002362602B|nr:hypothetical protein [Devosia sp. ZB163]MDC9824485.1 hypothetical protein [Devosia sp. ZB163]